MSTERVYKVSAHVAPGLFDMALETAMRLAEMLTLRWSDIDLSQCTIFLNRTKNGSRRQVPVSSVLLKLLQPLPKTSEFVFEIWWKGGDLNARKATSHAVSHIFSRRFKKAGVVGLRTRPSP